MVVKYGSLRFEEQIAFWKGKDLVPTLRWDDLKRDQHNIGFMVAGATKADLLADLHAAVDKAISKGITLEEFRRDFDKLVAKNGWTGWTGEGTDAGRAWRTRVIYETNLHTSYQAGRYAQLTNPDLLKSHPFWQYKHSDFVVHPREPHEKWNNIVLPWNHPWWQTHFTPNGWGCRCRIIAVRADQYKGQSAPDNGTYEWTDKKTGEVHTFPKGIDPFWDYAPGDSRVDFIKQQMLKKAEAMPPAIGNQLKNLVSQVPETSTIKPISEVLTLPKSKWTRQVSESVLQDINKVHQVDLTSVVAIETATTPRYEAAYHTDKSIIKLSTQALHPELSLTHEIGHFLDRQALGDGTTYASDNHPLLEQWRKSVEMSAATALLKASHEKIPPAYLAYLLSSKEQWARSYAQYITTKSNNPVLKNQLDFRRNHPDLLSLRYSQWQNDDFESIMLAIDNLFNELGWLK